MPLIVDLINAHLACDSLRITSADIPGHWLSQQRAQITSIIRKTIREFKRQDCILEAYSTKMEAL